MAAPSLRQANATQSFSSLSTIGVSLGVATRKRTILALWMWFAYNPGTLTLPAGFTIAASRSDPTAPRPMRSLIAYKLADGSEGTTFTPSWTVAGTGVNLGVCEFAYNGTLGAASIAVPGSSARWDVLNPAVFTNGADPAAGKDGLLLWALGKNGSAFLPPEATTAWTGQYQVARDCKAGYELLGPSAPPYTRTAANPGSAEYVQLGASLELTPYNPEGFFPRLW